MIHLAIHLCKDKFSRHEYLAHRTEILHISYPEAMERVLDVLQNIEPMAATI
jgi:hypothetical protein